MFINQFTYKMKQLVVSSKIQSFRLTSNGEQTLQILCIKIVHIVSLYCPIVAVVSWKDVERIIEAIFPLLIYAEKPAKVQDLVDKDAVAAEFKTYNEGRMLSEYACIMLCKHLNMLLTHLIEILEEANILGKWTNQIVRTVIFTDPIFTDIVPFLFDPFV